MMNRTYIYKSFVLILFFYSISMVRSQTNLDNTFIGESTFQPTIKDAVKFTEFPEIRDTVLRIKNANYSIVSNPLFPKYTVSPIAPAKMQNEPLTKLYHSLLKVGYGPIYNMPYGELWLNSTRSRDMAYGVHYKHFSSMSQLQDVGYSGFSDNEAEIFGKKFYKKHTLSGDFNYKRNVMHYYGFDTINKIKDKDFTKQRFQLFEPSVKLQSHYTDSSNINHTIGLSYYNLTDIYNANENNVKLKTDLSTYINKESFHVNVLADYYNHKQPSDTMNDFIMSLNPYFEANGKKWHADLGVTGTMDAFDGSTKFYFYPQINAHFNVYDNLIIPYAGVSGGLIKNSYRSMTNENPFLRPDAQFVNTNNRFNVFGGLRGNLSSATSYDAGVKYGSYQNMQFFLIDYETDQNRLDNKFKAVYADATLLTVSGSVKYQYKEKIHFTAKGNYYYYHLSYQGYNDKAFHKPNYDLTFSGLYNLKSKILIKADIFVIGSQWALTKEKETGDSITYKPLLLKGIVDCNLGVEYRYSKMLSFFVNFNNIANTRYVRWEKYPTQRFNMMLGLTFVPF